MELHHDRRREIRAHTDTVLGTDRSIPIPERALDEVELADEVEGHASVTARGVVRSLRLARLVKPAARVRETSGVDEGERLRDGLVRLVAVGE